MFCELRQLKKTLQLYIEFIQILLFDFKMFNVLRILFYIFCLANIVCNVRLAQSVLICDILSDFVCIVFYMVNKMLNLNICKSIKVDKLILSPDIHL